MWQWKSKVESISKWDSNQIKESGDKDNHRISTMEILQLLAGHNNNLRVKDSTWILIQGLQEISKHFKGEVLVYNDIEYQ